MPLYQLLTDRTLAQSSAITPTTLIHIVYTGDPSQNIAGSSYKAELQQLSSIFSGGTDTLVTGGTYSAGTITFTNSSGGTFDVTGLTTGATITIGGDYLPLSGGTVSGATNFTNGLTANTISASTLFVNGVQITGDTFVTGGTYSAGTITFTNNQNGQFPVTGLTEPFTGGSGNCITDLYITNLHGCSPITIHDNIQSVGSLATGATSFAFGDNVNAFGDYSHAEGFSTTSIDTGSHSEGNTTISIGQYSHAEGFGTTSLGNSSHTEGFETVSLGVTSHAEGASTTSLGNSSHAEGYLTISIGQYSHAEGDQTTSIGIYSHAEGASTTSSGVSSHAEGAGTTSSGDFSHAEGDTTTASGLSSHAEGVLTIASGEGSHAEGSGTTAFGNYSHSEGIGTYTSGAYQHATGKWNLTGDTTSGAFIVGNGTDNLNRSNLLFAAGNEVNISGKTITTNLQMTSGATNGYVLTSDASGNASWQNGTFTGGTVTGNTVFTQGLTATTISATTYLNLPVTADTNFANTNLTLNNDRIHNLNGNDLFFSEDGAGFGYISFGIFGGLGTGSFVVNGSTDTTLTINDLYITLRQLDNEFWVNSTETVVNETGNPNNFRVETDNNQNMFFVDGTNNKVGISTNTPSETLDVSGKTKTINFQMTSGATTGYVLTSDASGNASWQVSTGGGLSIDPYYNSGSGSTITWNVSGQSTNYEATLTAATTLNLTDVRNGDYGTIILTQDSVGGRTISLGTINGASGTHRVANGGGGSIVLTSNANAIDILTFTYNGSIMYWTVGNDYT